MSDTALESCLEPGLDPWPRGGLAKLKPRLASLTALSPFGFSPNAGIDTAPDARLGRMPSGFGRRLAGLAIRAGIGTALLVGAAAILVSALHHLPAAQPPAPHPARGAAWQEIVKPVQIYNLEAPEFAGAPLVYTARRHTAGGGREDVLALGTLDSGKPAIRLRTFRRGEEATSKVPLFAALAHEAAQVGLAIGRSGLPDLMATRFGRFEVVDISLVRQDAATAPCDGFRLLLDKPALAITGLACGRHATPMSHAEVGCLVERLDVAAARDDRELIDFFAESELRRNAACAGMRLGPDGLHAPWLDDKPAPVVAAHGKPATTRKRLRHR